MEAAPVNEESISVARIWHAIHALYEEDFGVGSPDTPAESLRRALWVCEHRLQPHIMEMAYLRDSGRITWDQAPEIYPPLWWAPAT